MDFASKQKASAFYAVQPAGTDMLAMIRAIRAEKPLMFKSVRAEQLAVKVAELDERMTKAGA